MTMSSLPTDATRSPFDAVADSYDQGFTFSKIGQAQRAAVWKELSRAFRSGDRVLEIGCGTGIDACFLAERGVSVVACDSSAAMIRIAERRVRQRRAHRVDLRLLSAEGLGRIQSEAPFDGIFSNFGALNCVEDLQAVARSLGHLLKPGGTALLCFLGPSCFWEVFWYLLRGQPRKAFRRWHPGGVTATLAPGASLQVRYYGARSLARIFAPSLRLHSWTGIGLLVPPSYAESAAKRISPLLKLAEWADSSLARCRVLRGFSDHILLRLERAPS
ncbi:MAG: methyltransferase domain-containing protein [Terriglobales bacterium]|jgi:SAM-dependent methyltransferase